MSTLISIIVLPLLLLLKILLLRVVSARLLLEKSAKLLLLHAVAKLLLHFPAVMLSALLLVAAILLVALLLPATLFPDSVPAYLACRAWHGLFMNRGVAASHCIVVCRIELMAHLWVGVRFICVTFWEVIAT